MGEGEDVFDCDSIDLPIIKYRVVASILLSDVEDRCQVWGFRFSDEAGIFLFLNVFLLKLFLSAG
jgi:hypothetical protein